jgi:hypothetical protein
MGSKVATHKGDGFIDLWMASWMGSLTASLIDGFMDGMGSWMATLKVSWIGF